MKNFNPLLFLVYIAIFISCSTDDTPSDTNSGGVTEEIVRLGDLDLKTQEDIDQFIDGEHIIIEGNLKIGNNEKTNIKNLSNLEGIEKVTGNLNIINNPQLVNLDGLERLEELNGDIEITGNSALVDYSALKNLFEANGFSGNFLASLNKYNPALETLKNGNYRFIVKKLIAITTIPKEGAWVAVDSIFYNEEGKENEIRTYYDGKIEYKDLYYYYPDQIISKFYGATRYVDGELQLIEYPNQKIIYTLENNLIIRSDGYSLEENGEESLSFFFTYENDSSKEINNLKRTDQYDAEGNLKEFQLIEYTDDLGSSITRFANTDGLIYKEQVLKMDEKVGWYQYINLFDYQYQHNRISWQTEDLNTGEITGSESIYTYDEFGYPLTEEVQYIGGGGHTYLFEFQ